MKFWFILTGVLLGVSSAPAQTQTQTNTVAFLPPPRLEVGSPLAGATHPGTNGLRLVPGRTVDLMATNAVTRPDQVRLQARPDTAFLEPSAGLVLPQPRPYEMPLGRRTVSGMAVQAFKAMHRLQLLNPAAPAEYGSGLDNLDQPSGITGPALKVFAINF